MQARFRFCFFLFLNVICAMLELQDFSNDNENLFTTNDPLSDFPTLDGSSPDLIAWNTDNELTAGGGGSGQALSLFTLDLPLLLPPAESSSSDQTNMFLTASCSSSSSSSTTKNKLKARRAEDYSQILASSCPPPNTNGLSAPAPAPIPQLPTTLDELTDQLSLPTNNQDQEQGQDQGKKEPELDLVPNSWWPSPLPLTSSDETDPNCPEDRPYRVCCICNRPFAYAWCHDCLLSRFISLSFFEI